MVSATPSRTFSRAVLVSSSWGSCSSMPTVAPGASIASPLRKSVSMPGHDLQQRRLARAVVAEHADLRAGEERQRDVVEDRLVGPVGLRQPLHLEDVLRRHEASRIGGSGRDRIPDVPDEDRLGVSATPKASSTPRAISWASATSSAVVPAPRLVSASTCLAGDRDAVRVAVALGEAGVVDEPSGAGLDAAVGLGEAGDAVAGAGARSASNCAGSRIGLVKNEPALTRVGVAGVEDHALGAAEREHGLAHGRRAARSRRPRRRGRAPARRSGSGAEAPDACSSKVTRRTT